MSETTIAIADLKEMEEEIAALKDRVAALEALFHEAINNGIMPACKLLAEHYRDRIDEIKRGGK